MSEIMVESYTTPATYHSLAELRMRKSLLLKDIQKDSDKIDQQWHSLFQRPQSLSKDAAPSKRIGSIISLGGSFIDGALLAWKLYRKFKK